MLKNYLKIAWRNITRHKVYTTINVIGLSFGICACIVIYLVNSYELSFDTFHPEKNRIYRIMGDITEHTGDRLHFARIPFAVSQIGRVELSGVSEIAGIIPYNATVSIPDGNNTVKHFDSKVKAANYVTTVIAEPQYFTIFKYKWLAGNPAIALSDPFKVVLSENKARQYFGNEPLNNIIGKEIIYDDSLKVSVSGIIEGWNKNTDLGFTDFISFNTIQSSFLRNNINLLSWQDRDMPVWTFTKLSVATSPARINAQMAALVKRHGDAQTKLTLWLEPLSDIHFNADVVENSIRTADKKTLYSLMAIALFILILAIINFVNLSTARSFQRAKEVGIRKVLGSRRGSIALQFFTETFLLTISATLLAVLFVRPVLTIFHSFIPTGITFNCFEPSTILFLLVVILATSMLAGLYPAKVISSHLPVLSLKGKVMNRVGEKWLLRKGLIIFQFTVSLIFIISSIVIANQLAYTRTKNMGFTSDAIVSIPTPFGDSLAKIALLDQKIKEVPGVTKTALQWVPPMTGNGRRHAIKFNSTDLKETGVAQIAANENFIPLYGIKLMAGRNLIHSDSLKEIVINENLSKLMGCKKPEEAVGKILYWDDKPYPVVGVVMDFHSRSFHDLISPLCIVNRPDREGTIAIKLSSGMLSSNSINKTLAQIQRLWKQVYPGATFEYQFYDKSLELLYEKDEQTAILVTAALAITVFISCMGLFGLALFTTEKRAKEISIRKILGAGFTSIIMMLSRDFIMLVVIAFIIASPVASYFMNLWLHGFAYRISISWWMFITAGLAAVLIALLTVSFQALKAAISNPVKSLRTE